MSAFQLANAALATFGSAQSNRIHEHVINAKQEPQSPSELKPEQQSFATAKAIEYSDKTNNKADDKRESVLCHECRGVLFGDLRASCGLLDF